MCCCPETLAKEWLRVIPARGGQWFSLAILESPWTEEKSMPSSLDTVSMLTSQVSRRAHLRSQKKLIAFKVFDFRRILTGPRGCPEAM